MSKTAKQRLPGDKPEEVENHLYPIEGDLWKSAAIRTVGGQLLPGGEKKAPPIANTYGSGDSMYDEDGDYQLGTVTTFFQPITRDGKTGVVDLDKAWMNADHAQKKADETGKPMELAAVEALNGICKELEEFAAELGEVEAARIRELTAQVHGFLPLVMVQSMRLFLGHYTELNSMAKMTLPHLMLRTEDNAVFVRTLDEPDHQKGKSKNWPPKKEEA